MRKWLFALISILLIASCSSDPLQNEGEASVTVRIADSIPATSAIMPTVGDSTLSSTDITHYRIWLYSGSTEQEAKEKASSDKDPDAATDPVADGRSDYQARRNTSYTLGNIESGLYWVARVRAYVNTASSASPSYLMVAEAVIDAQAVFGHGDSIAITLSKLGNSSETTVGNVDKAGVVSVTLKLPNGSDGAEYSWTAVPLSGTMGSNTSIGEGTNTLTLSTDNDFIFTIPEETLEQGIYLLNVSITKTTDDSTYMSRSGSTIMRLLPGLPAAGTIDLNYEEDLSPDLGITDALGNEIEFTPELEWDSANKKGEFSFELVSEIPENVSYNYEIYIDGVSKITNTIKTKGPHTNDITELLPGKHTVVFVIRNASEPNSIGYYSDVLEVSYNSNTDITVK